MKKVLVKNCNASLGPKVFGLDDILSPTGWFLITRGTLIPREDAKYRFVGWFDDEMIVRFNDHVVLECQWNNTTPATGKCTGWKVSDTATVGTMTGESTSYKVVFGDWFHVKKGVPFNLEILIGENPGGVINGCLMIQQSGVEYEKTSSGQPILPLFITDELTSEEKAEIESYALKLDPNSPMFD